MSRLDAMTEEDHLHDWRVDPSQVIVMVGDQSRVRLACARCEMTALAYSNPSRVINPDDRTSWRPYLVKRGDVIRSGYDLD